MRHAVHDQRHTRETNTENARGTEFEREGVLTRRWARTRASLWSFSISTCSSYSRWTVVKVPVTGFRQCKCPLFDTYINEEEEEEEEEKEEKEKEEEEKKNRRRCLCIQHD